MKDEPKTIHPYVPNSVPDVQAEMLAEIGAESIEALYEDIPESLRLAGRLDLPEPFIAELDLKRHVDGILARNTTCDENLSFLGGGCWHHYVPAICDEINQRSEFLTAYAGEPFEDHGRFQALFEYASMMGELLEMDVVNVPTYDGCQAAATAIRMAARITGRREVLVADTVAPERLSVIRGYGRGVIDVKTLGRHPETGGVDLDDLRSKLTEAVAGVYFDNPSYLGCIEDRGETVSALAHEAGALSIVGVDPITLGVIVPPSRYGADIACGDIQCLGMHMQYGGGQAGFIATRDEERFVREYPSRLFGIESTRTPGEYGFGDVAYERTSFADREHAKEFVGTAAALWGITAGVYLALAGPQGMRDVGNTILQKSHYLGKRLSETSGLRFPFPRAHYFKEIVVDYGPSGNTVAEVHRRLLERRIFGGVDISSAYPDLGQAALICVTEMHTQEDIDTLVEAIREVL